MESTTSVGQPAAGLTTMGVTRARSARSGDRRHDSAVDIVPDGGVIVDELTRHPWIAASRGSATHSALTRLTAAWRFTPRTDHECSELSSVVSLVAGGLGAAVIPQLAWADAADRTQLLDTDSVDAAAGISSGHGVRRIAALVRSTRRRVPAIELFLAALQRAADAEQMGIGAT